MPNRYVIAVKREQRDNAPSDWRNSILAIEGVTIVGKENDGRALVITADDAAIEKVKAVVSEFCHVELEIPFTPQTSRYTRGR